MEKESAITAPSALAQGTRLDVFRLAFAKEDGEQVVDVAGERVR